MKRDAKTNEALRLVLLDNNVPFSLKVFFSTNVDDLDSCPTREKNMERRKRREKTISVGGWKTGGGGALG
jgi:hypothetical protein